MRVLLRANADFSHWELLVDNTGEVDGDRLHFEVRRYSSLTHGRAFFYQTPDDSDKKHVNSVDIIETPSHIFTRGVRIFDMDSDVNTDIYTFAGITINHSEQRTLEVINIGRDIESASAQTPAFIPDLWTENELVGAFDRTQQMIRPSLDGEVNLPDPLKYDNDGGYPDGIHWPQGETFNAELFPSAEKVKALLDLGINPDLIVQLLLACLDSSKHGLV